MEESTKCPICDKTGISDFLSEDVVCSCCGSDLSVYRKLFSLTEITSTKTDRKGFGLFSYAAFVLMIIFLGTTIWFFYHVQNQRSLEKQYTSRIENLERVNLALSDSIQTLNLKTTTMSTKINDKEGIMIYVVRRGDGFCKISQRLYGTESRYQEIIKMNNLYKQTNLHPGDTLIVNAR